LRRPIVTASRDGSRRSPPGLERANNSSAPKRRNIAGIHLATHGFLAPQSRRIAARHNEDDPAHAGRLFETADEVRGFHPDLMSGIALAGANHHWGGRGAREAQRDFSKDLEDGILTALDVESLDLNDVNLVVLSACETGLGRVTSGEGVLGLQRAFQIAGAKNVVASLWKVDDQATAALMRIFYQKLWVEKKTPVAALRESQVGDPPASRAVP